MYTLKEYSELTKRYINNYVLSKTKDNGIIDFNEDYITEESIDNYITASLCTSYDSSNPYGYWEHIYETLIKSHDYTKLCEYLKNGLMMPHLLKSLIMILTQKPLIYM